MAISARKRFGVKRHRASPRPTRSTAELLMALGGVPVTRLGIRLLKQGSSYALADHKGEGVFTTIRLAVKRWVVLNPRVFGWYMLKHYPAAGMWELVDRRTNRPVKLWISRPLRNEVADAIRRARATDSSPSFSRPNTLGWRCWKWDPRQRCLVSPAQGEPWPEYTLMIKRPWNEDEVVRGVSGIHACRLPKGEWKTAERPNDMPAGHILGVVERFGKYALGEMGWRAEWVVIKELLAPDEATARLLRGTYPEVKVTVAHEHHWLRKELFRGHR